MGMTRTFFAAFLLLFVPALASATLSLEVDLDDRQLRVYEEKNLIQMYPVSVGKDEKPTPTGRFSIRRIVWNPSWVPPNEKWARGKTAKAPGHPDNPMKRVKMFFKEPDYYIHGTSDEESLGRAASHGCIRMAPDDVTRLGQLVMERGGKPMPEPWYRRIFRRKTTKVVYLTVPVPVDIRS